MGPAGWTEGRVSCHHQDSPLWKTSSSQYLVLRENNFVIPGHTRKDLGLHSWLRRESQREWFRSEVKAWEEQVSAFATMGIRR